MCLILTIPHILRNVYLKDVSIKSISHILMYLKCVFFTLVVTVRTTMALSSLLILMSYLLIVSVLPVVTISNVCKSEESIAWEIP